MVTKHRSRSDASTRRLSIITSKEVDELYELPSFDPDQREHFFQLSKTERRKVDAVRNASTAVHLVLQLGYFKAKRQFFVFTRAAVKDDIEFVIRTHFPKRTTVAAIKPLSKPTRLKLQRIVLKLFKYRVCKRATQQELERRARRAAMLSTQPIYILREALQYLEAHKIVAPPYRFLQEMIGRVVAGERKRITELLEQALTEEARQQLDELLRSDEKNYRIRILRHEPRDFSYQQLRGEVERRRFFLPLFTFAAAFLPTAGLSADSIKYYASLVTFYTIYKLQRMAPAVVRLYLLCFAYHRFRTINDNLIEAFVHLIHQYEELAKTAAKEAAQRALAEASEHLKAAGQVLDLFVDKSIPASAPFSSIKKKAFSLLEQERFPLVSAYLCNIEFDRAAFEWEYYAALSFKFKRNLRQLFTDLSFGGRVENEPLLNAVLTLQGAFREGKSPRQIGAKALPLGIIPKTLQRYLFEASTGPRKKRKLHVDRYEFLVYRLLRNSLEAGDLYVRDSNEFRRFEDDLISDERWRDKAAVLQEIGALVLTTPIEQTLAEFAQAIDAKFARVNERIDAQTNEHIKVTGAGDNRRWSLIYPEDEEPINNPFYSQLPGIGIADLLWFVAEMTGFLGAFTHVLDRYAKHRANPQELFADIVAMGTNMGIWKMADVSGLSHPSLLTTARNYLRLETLNAANDAISNATAALPVFKLFDIQDAVHSSSDGQRIETQRNTINARHSPKYFGLQKGVSAYTLVANHVPINAKIIGTHEHESHYVFDLIYNNTTDVKPERHSTDTHGTNQVNFWTLYTFDYQFAPRYRDIHKRTDSLVTFGSLQPHAGRLIRPSKCVSRDLIIREWPNVQRIMASLAQKDVSQATIVRKLSSYARQNQTKKALWELEAIRRTLYVLDFIDDVSLRKSVQRALNRGEGYHRMRRAIAYVNSGKFRVRTEAEQQVWNECSRLIANAIIFYNSLLLSRVYERKREEGDEEAIAAIRRMSPVAWQHVNLIGKFEFGASGPRIDIDALAARYSDPEFWKNALRDKDEDEPEA